MADTLRDLNLLKARLTRRQGANHPDTIAADRAMRAERLALAIRRDGIDVLDEAITRAERLATDHAGYAAAVARGDLFQYPPAEARAQAGAGNVLPMVRP
jgi:hypothetical protein